MRSANRIALKDLKLRIRDRSAIILGVLAPLALAFILNLVFGSAFDTTTGLDLDYGVVDLDESEISSAFVQTLRQIEDDGLLTLEEFENAGDAEAAIEDDDLDAYLVLGEGLGQAAFTGGSATIQVIGSVDSPTSTQIAASIADRFSTGVDTAQLAVATTASLANATPTPGFVTSLEGDPQQAAFAFELTDVTADTRQLDSTTYFAAGMAAFFVFFTVSFGVSGLLEEERDGTLARLLAAPIRRETVIAGKGILSFNLGVLSMAILVVATSLDFLMGADWGNPIGVAILVVSIVLAATGIMGLVASVAKTPEGAGNLGGIIAVILGMLGGTFFQIGQGEDLLSRLSFLTPHAWFMRGLGDIAGDASWTSALPAAGAMMIFALVAGAIGWVLLRRRLAT